MNQNLFEHLSKHITLSKEEQTLIASKFIEKSVAGKEILLYEGAPCNHLYFVSEGLLKAYCHDKDGKEITILFAKKDWWISDKVSFVSRTPSTMTIEALKESTVLRISYDCLNELYEEIPSFNKLWRILFQNAYFREQNRVYQLLTLPASKRYELFVEKYPEVASLITQRQLASYLGITPEFLSSIKSNLNL